MNTIVAMHQALGGWAYLIAYVLAFLLSFGGLAAAGAMKESPMGHSGSGAALAGIMLTFVFGTVFVCAWNSYAPPDVTNTGNTKPAIQPR